ncbi:hypothetical protein A3K87_24060 [Variovorax paradoxus]|uniref:Tyr recombinase domain-containing protein n=1 Tax=Variovorax paradoxus TaxID=34073 RepID=A0AA91I953_VARPD|nr:tyrosine-type recombinase/integrase [Variovorax paradoxus]OAK60194.1 hypothetical protein A3K87_24060 [Variovorax paradoxus]
MTERSTNRLKFSTERIRALPCAQGQTEYHYDTECKGLALSVGKSGRKSFLLYKKVRGKPQRISIGAFPAISVEQARKKAAKLVGEIASGLIDGAISGTQRFSEAFRDYMKEHAIPGKRSGEEDLEIYERNLTGKRTVGERRGKRAEGGRRLIDLSSYKLADISGPLLRQLHRDMSVATPIAANRTMALVSSVFTHAIREGRYDKLNPARAVQRNRESSRERFLSREEAKWLWVSLDAEPDLQIVDFVRLALATGARRGNVLAMRKADVDLSQKTWRIGITKNGTPQSIPLSVPAVEVLTRRLADPSSPEWVFPSSSKTGHFVEPKKGWQRVLDRATAMRLRDALDAAHHERVACEINLQVCTEFPGIAVAALREAAGVAGVDVQRLSMTDLRIHDLRRTVGSWLASGGASLPLIGRVLNHKSSQSTQVYARFMLDPVRQALNQVAADFANASSQQDIQ